MHTFMALLALTTSLSTANVSTNPAWLNDYAAARERVNAVGRPMAVFVGSGQDGWTKVVKDGAVSAEVRKLLADKFVCLYVDTDTRAGKTLAGAFQVSAKGLVISDRAGTSQAYSLSGDLTGPELARTLEKYADREVQSTETVVRSAPVVVQPAPVTYQVRPAYAPQYYVPQYRVVPGYPTGGS
jgi:hypothetical protein